MHLQRAMALFLQAFSLAAQKLQPRHVRLKKPGAVL